LVIKLELLCGANIGMIFMMAVEQEYDELNVISNVPRHDDANLLFFYSYSSHRMTFGGGCEMSLHADKVVAAAETYMG
jgi:3-hydroxyacyl-CoA dehydrogenase